MFPSQFTSTYGYWMPVIAFVQYFYPWPADVETVYNKCVEDPDMLELKVDGKLLQIGSNNSPSLCTWEVNQLSFMWLCFSFSEQYYYMMEQYYYMMVFDQLLLSKICSCTFNNLAGTFYGVLLIFFCYSLQFKAAVFFWKPQLNDTMSRWRHLCCLTHAFEFLLWLLFPKLNSLSYNFYLVYCLS